MKGKQEVLVRNPVREEKRSVERTTSRYMWGDNIKMVLKGNIILGPGLNLTGVSWYVVADRWERVNEP